MTATRRKDGESALPPLVIEVWSDYVCPFCYLEVPVLDRLQQAYGAELTVHWRAFELRPDPVPTLQPDGDYLRDTWARSVYPMAAERGMTLRLPPVQPRSRLAFEAAAHARDRGRGDAMHLALFRAFFEHGSDIGDLEVLVATGVGLGLDAAALRADLVSGVYTASVHEDQRLAQSLGIGGVPMMVLRRAGASVQQGLGVSGAQPEAVLRSAIAELLGWTV